MNDVAGWILQGWAYVFGAERRFVELQRPAALLTLRNGTIGIVGLLVVDCESPGSCSQDKESTFVTQ
jgi:hypothetical protein